MRRKLRRDDDEAVAVKFGDQCIGDYFLKCGTADDDDGLPVDTTALVLIDVATGWIAVYPTDARS